MGICQNNVSVLNDQSQSHLVKHWQNLPSRMQRRKFEEQLNLINIHEVTNMYKKSCHSSSSKVSEGGSTTEAQTSSTCEYYPIPDSRIVKKQQIDREKVQLDKIGLQAIKNGQVAVFILASNQNSELDLDIPLGIYDIGLDSDCSIFQILVRKLTLLQKLSGAVDEKKIKLYIMTNTFNKNDIKGHFKSKNYFEYGSSNIFFFSQPVEPFVDQHGKIVLKNQFNIYMSSRGTGLLYQQIKQKNLLSHLDSQGSKYVFIGPVHNILLKIADPTMLGYLIRQKKSVVATCVQSENQNLGCIGLASDLKHIKVYQDRVAITNNSTKWMNTESCYMTFRFLGEMVNNQGFLQEIKQNFNDVLQEIRVYDPTLNKKITTKCLYFQSFYHKIFEKTYNMAILQIDPVSQFAPIKKGGKGLYSIVYARDALWNWNKQLLQNVGIDFEGEGHVEIHPSLTYEGENLRQILLDKNIKGPIKLPECIF